MLSFFKGVIDLYLFLKAFKYQIRKENKRKKELSIFDFYCLDSRWSLRTEI